MDPFAVNWLAVVLATLSTFVVGYIWYAPWFLGRIWAKDVGLDLEHPIMKSTLPKTMTMSFIVSFIKCWFLALFLGQVAGGFGGLTFYMQVNMGIAFGAVLMTNANHLIFERSPLRLLLVNGGHVIVEFAVIGLILYYLGTTAA